MNLRQTAEVAAFAAMKADEIIQRPEPVSTASLHGYWKYSQMRLRCWFAGLRSLPAPCRGTGSSSPHHLRERVGLARSILVSELLTRAWSTVLMARDAARSESTTGELVRIVFQGQQEARREVLSLLADEERLPIREAATVERLRRRVERWTDLLLGPLVQNYGVVDFAFDPQRALESVRSASLHRPGQPERAIHHLTLIGLSRAIPRNPRDDQPASTLDWAVAQSVLSGISSSDINDTHSVHRQSHATATSEYASAFPVIPAADSAPARRIRFADLRRNAGGTHHGAEPEGSH